MFEHLFGSKDITGIRQAQVILSSLSNSKERTARCALLDGLLTIPAMAPAELDQYDPIGRRSSTYHTTLYRSTTIEGLDRPDCLRIFLHVSMLFESTVYLNVYQVAALFETGGHQCLRHWRYEAIALSWQSCRSRPESCGLSTVVCTFCTKCQLDAMPTSVPYASTVVVLERKFREIHQLDGTLRG